MASEKRNEQIRRCDKKVSIYYSVTLNRRTNAELILRLESEKAAGYSIASVVKAAVKDYCGEAPQDVEPVGREKRIDKDWTLSLKFNRNTDAAVIEKIEAAKERGESAMGFIKRASAAYFGL